ncbi:MAG: hypothetical protein RJA70_1025 [Pseudomonadota bacterium]|jgi:tetratricopeptide (TPR) repeat protein
MMLLAVATLALPVAAQDAEVRRDPKGVTGASPYLEQLKKADNAFVAGDYPAAQREFEAAIKLDPKNPLGHTRVAQVFIAKGELVAAFDRLEVASRFASDLVQRAKVQFLQADIREREGKLTQAKTRWEGYQKLVALPEADGASTGKVYPATAVERIRRIDDKAVRDADYTEVKTRIENREKELTSK